MTTDLESERYECYVCLGESTFEEGVATCAAHFFCNDCIRRQFEMLALQPGFQSFPAKCCHTDTIIGRNLAEHLLSTEVLQAYAKKEAEFYCPEPMCVYCVSPECNKWLSPQSFEDTPLYTLAKCDCGTATCIGCKGLWKENHICGQGLKEKPEWLPEYSPTFRVKKCPLCNTYMEHREACNHMGCGYCGHNFCWICLKPWAPLGFHEGTPDRPGCPGYGDPEYDNEGYEVNTRGLHRDTGLTREGRDALGLSPHQTELRNPGLINPGAFVNQMDIGILMENQVGLDIGMFQQDRDADLPQLEEDDHWEFQGDEEFIPNMDHLDYASFDQLDCRHHFNYSSTYDPCDFCHEYLPHYQDMESYTCTRCSANVCQSCEEFIMQVDEWTLPTHSLYSWVSVIQWAEQGEVPFRWRYHRKLETSWYGNESIEWLLFGLDPIKEEAENLQSVKEMFEHHQALHEEANPFIYYGFGIAEMFEREKRDMEDIYVVEEDFGFPGFSMTVNMRNNYFWVLADEE